MGASLLLCLSLAAGLIAVPAAHAADESASASGESVGIGIAVKKEGEGLLVLAVAFMGPARFAGLEPRDTILSVNGVSLAGLDTTAGVALILGPAGSEVTLEVRDRYGTVKQLSAKRKAVPPEDVVAYKCDRGDCENGWGERRNTDGTIMVGWYDQGTPDFFVARDSGSWRTSEFRKHGARASAREFVATDRHLFFALDAAQTGQPMPAAEAKCSSLRYLAEHLVSEPDSFTRRATKPWRAFRLPGVTSKPFRIARGSLTVELQDAQSMVSGETVDPDLLRTADEFEACLPDWKRLDIAAHERAGVHGAETARHVVFEMPGAWPKPSFVLSRVTGQSDKFVGELTKLELVLGVTERSRAGDSLPKR